MQQFSLYHHNTLCWQAITSALESATQTIDIEHFIFKQGGIGDELLSILYRKAAAGVKVRLLLDAIGSDELAVSNLVARCTDAGIELRFFNSIIPLRLSHHTPIFFRDHQKLIVVDKRTGLTGGVCIDERMRAWRDTLIIFEGAAVSDMQRAFDCMWKIAHKEMRLRDMPKYKVAPEQYLLDIPFSLRRPAYRALRRAIRAAKRYIYLETPYFVPPHLLVRLLKSARRRGVDVRLILPERSDASIADLAAESYFENLLTAGVRIYRYIPSTLHAKIAVIDGSFSMLGSHNLDHLSFQYNFEGSLISNDSALAKVLTEQLTVDMAHSSELQFAQWYKRGYVARFMETLIWPLSFLM